MSACTCLYPPQFDDGAWISSSCPVHMRDWSGRAWARDDAGDWYEVESNQPQGQSPSATSNRHG